MRKLAISLFCFLAYVPTSDATITNLTHTRRTPNELKWTWTPSQDLPVGVSIANTVIQEVTDHTIFYHGGPVNSVTVDVEYSPTGTGQFKLEGLIEDTFYPSYGSIFGNIQEYCILVSCASKYYRIKETWSNSTIVYSAPFYSKTTDNVYAMHPISNNNYAWTSNSYSNIDDAYVGGYPPYCLNIEDDECVDEEVIYADGFEDDYKSQKFNLSDPNVSALTDYGISGAAIFLYAGGHSPDYCTASIFKGSTYTNAPTITGIGTSYEWFTTYVEPAGEGMWNVGDADSLGVSISTLDLASTEELAIDSILVILFLGDLSPEDWQEDYESNP